MSQQKKKIRKEFREKVFQRDEYQCAVCSMPQSKAELDAHHITDRNEMPQGGYVPENGISLCLDCHLKAEEWHLSGHQKFVAGYHPEELYQIISSSCEKAIKACEKLLK